MNTIPQTSEETAALALLKSTKLPLLEAAQVACAAARAGRGKMKRALRCIAAGEEELKRRERTVTFDKAVKAALEARKHRRARTLCGVFSTAIKRGWCSENPVARVEAPRVVGKTVPILTPEEAEQLVQAAREYKGGICLPAVGLMLYAGIRPHEVARLTWADVDLAGKRVNIAPQHSKTGGARPVTLLRPALQLLSTTQAPAPQRICPPQWLHHWRAVRRRAGWNRLTRPWSQDICRHSYASYHAAHFRNLHELQLQMGHRSTELLRTRYLNLPGATSTTAYWK